MLVLTPEIEKIFVRMTSNLREMPKPPPTTEKGLFIAMVKGLTRAELEVVTPYIGEDTEGGRCRLVRAMEASGRVKVIEDGEAVMIDGETYVNFTTS